MALYLIGDVQGCDAALNELLLTIDFSPSRDILFVLGDLVNRGPDSDKVLRRLMSFDHAARCLLGNHDLHLLAVAHGSRPAKRKDTLQTLLQSPDSGAMLDWLRHQRMAIHESIANRSILMVHAGVLPQWTLSQTMALAAEVEAVLQSEDATPFFDCMYADRPAQWSDALQGFDRIRVIVNALTRLRYCTVNGAMEFQSKGSATNAPMGFLPWFDVPQRKTAGTTVAFGHWSTLGWLNRDDVFSLDFGCVWGGQLAALRFPDFQNWLPELITIDCPQMQQPGG